MRTPRSERYDQILQFIKEYSKTHTFSPSLREICDGIGFRSTSTAHTYLHEMEEQGRVSLGDGQNRAITILDERYIDKGLPVLGMVTAGEPILAEENIITHIEFKPRRRHDNDLFGLRVKDDNMKNIGIFDGDTVIVEQTTTVGNGDIVVALIPEEGAIVKTFYKEGGNYRLQSENEMVEPLIVRDVDILGKVVYLVREFEI